MRKAFLGYLIIHVIIFGGIALISSMNTSMAFYPRLLIPDTRYRIVAILLLIITLLLVVGWDYFRRKVAWSGRTAQVIINLLVMFILSLIVPFFLFSALLSYEDSILGWVNARNAVQLSDFRFQPIYDQNRGCNGMKMTGKIRAWRNLTISMGYSTGEDPLSLTEFPLYIYPRDVTLPILYVTDPRQTFVLSKNEIQDFSIDLITEGEAMSSELCPKLSDSIWDASRIYINIEKIRGSILDASIHQHLFDLYKLQTGKSLLSGNRS